MVHRGPKWIRTWRHVKGGTTAIITRDAIRGGKSKVGEFDRAALIGDEDVLRLQIAMVDSLGMAKLDGIQNLQEGMLGQTVISNETALFGDIGKKISFRAEFENHERAIWAVEDSDQGHNVGMLTGSVMESDFSSLDATLASVQAGLGESFDGVGDAGQDIDGLVDDPKGADSED